MNGRDPICKFALKTVSCALLLTAAGPLSFAQTPAENTPAAMAELARRYENGIGCPRDIGRALMYYKQAAADGEPTAMVALGDLYHEGRCVPPDHRYALDMYRRSAEAGFAPGMMRYGQALESIARREDGIVWYRKAAAKGYGPAMTHLGDILADTEWYRRAVAARHPAAFAKLAETVPSAEVTDLLRTGAELGDPTAQARYGFRIEKQDPAGAAKLYAAAAEAGDSVAMARLAYFAENGLGGRKQSSGDALLWYTKAAAAGEPDALYWVGRREEAEGKTADARIRYRSAATKGHAASMARLAALNGDASMLRAAATAGDRDATYAVAVQTKNGDLMRQAAAMGHPDALAATGETDKAAALGHVPSLLKLGKYKEAADAGSPEGLYRYGLTLGDKAEGTRYIQRAADAGYPAAMRELAVRFESGSGAAADPGASKLWFARAAEAGDPQALYRTGDEAAIRKSAEGGYPPAMVRVAELTNDKSWLEKAAGAGYPNAWTKLGQLDKGAAAGDPEAKMLLGDRAKKSGEAYRLYTEAANAGYAPAMRRLGDCHMQGRGTSVSEIDGVNWYRKAVLAGDAESMAVLKKLGKTL